jgi:group I intron endonuclease
MAREKICGIYCIENKVNGKKYIGQAVDVAVRWSQHKLSLNNNKHVNNILQNAWNKYGKDNFNFYLIERCYKSWLDRRERYWIKYYNTFKDRTKGYNLDNGGKSNRKRAKETKEKSSISRSKSGTALKRKDATSQFLGVRKRSDFIWECHFINSNNRYVIGTFSSEEDAARAHDKFVVDNKIDRIINFEIYDENWIPKEPYKYSRNPLKYNSKTRKIDGIYDNYCLNRFGMHIKILLEKENKTKKELKICEQYLHRIRGVQ